MKGKLYKLVCPFYDVCPFSNPSCYGYEVLECEYFEEHIKSVTDFILKVIKAYREERKKGIRVVDRK